MHTVIYASFAWWYVGLFFVAWVQKRDSERDKKKCVALKWHGEIYMYIYKHKCKRDMKRDQ